MAISEERERKQFMNRLNQFIGEIGKPMIKLPIMGYKELDLYTLFKEVMSFGGFLEVVKNVGTWSKIWKKLANFDPSITDASFRLRKNYERYLLDYEFKCYPEHKKQALERERQAQLKKIHAADRSQKKHKKKSPSSTKEIPRDLEGNPKLPLVLGEVTILSLGTIIPKRPYVTEKHVWPIGFCSTRYFSSMKNSSQRVKYTSQIVDANDKPQFVVVAEDDQHNPIISHSPSGAWRIILKKVMGNSIFEDSRKNIAVSGRVRFGLAHPVVTRLIRELPNGDKFRPTCSTTCPSSSLHAKRKRETNVSSSEEESYCSESEIPESEINSTSDFSEPEDFGFPEQPSGKRSLIFYEDFDEETAVLTLSSMRFCPTTVY
jgi:hypothetical protein